MDDHPLADAVFTPPAQDKDDETWFARTTGTDEFNRRLAAVAPDQDVTPKKSLELHRRSMSPSKFNALTQDGTVRSSPGIKELGLVSLHRPRRSSLSKYGSKSARSPVQSPRKGDTHGRGRSDSPLKSDLALSSPTRSSRHVRMESFVTVTSETDVSETSKHVTLSVLDEQSELLEKMARQERKCLELKKMYAREEAELYKLRQQWESMFNQSTLDDDLSSATGTSFGRTDTPPNALNISRALHIDRPVTQSRSAFYQSPAKLAALLSGEASEQEYTEVQTQAARAYEATKQKVSGLGKMIGGMFDGLILPDAEVADRNRLVRNSVAQSRETPQVARTGARDTARRKNGTRSARAVHETQREPLKSKENITPLQGSTREPMARTNESSHPSWTWRSATLKMFESIDTAFGTYNVDPPVNNKQESATKRQAPRKPAATSLDNDSDATIGH